MVPNLRSETRMIALVKDTLLAWILYCNTL
jgi:hypothetical protein